MPTPNSHSSKFGYDVPYRPSDPDGYDPQIALVGCGEITQHHLEAYKKAGYDVAAFCDLDQSTARDRRDEYYPDADVYTDASEVFERIDIDVVDIATHPKPREQLIEDALRAGKHVLSQKPFVLDLDTGERLVALAERQGVKLAVNQNGRWAPHFSYIRNAIEAGCIGDVICIDCSVHWDHDWITGTPFDDIKHVIFYDFAIHWFDNVANVMKEETPVSVTAVSTPTQVQTAKPPLLGDVMIEYDNAHASLTFDGGVQHGETDRTFVAGTHGSLESSGPDLGDQEVTLHTDSGTWRPYLEGSWFPDGFHGTMAELLSAIEKDREPTNSGRDNLNSLALCFAAIASAEDGEPKTPGAVRALRDDI